MRASLRLDEKPVIFVLVTLFVAGVVFTMWHLSRLQSQLNETTALEHAKMHVETIAEFRTLYTEEVVEVARDRGIAVTHDYKHREGAIPLPATLSMLLGKRIGELGSGARTRLYSAYPFPWRKDENQRLFQDPSPETHGSIGRRIQVRMTLSTGLNNCKAAIHSDMRSLIGCVLPV